MLHTYSQICKSIIHTIHTGLENHPLFVLERHLLNFETANPVGPEFLMVNVVANENTHH